MKQIPSVTVIMPALNEQDNILKSLGNTLQAMHDEGIRGEIIVINDGSSDKTGDMVDEIAAVDDRVRVIHHPWPCGIGASFWEGVDAADKEIAVMMPGDNENDPWEILRYCGLLHHVDIVIPFVFNKNMRSIFRNTLSFVYRFIINTTFGVYFNYTNGTVMYRKSVLDVLSFRSSGFFYQTDILVRLVKSGFLFAEVPYRLCLRNKGVSKAVSFPSFLAVVKGYISLVRDIYIDGQARKTAKISGDCQTDRRKSGKSKMV